MRIFYGVQGTGNGHITRARVMAKELYAAGIDVTYQFTGRPKDSYFEMAIFRDYLVKTGLTFSSKNGQVSYLKTAIETKPFSFIKDIRAMDFSGYDLVISDFEPVTAWAAKLKRTRVLGIGHQYAFKHNIPKAGADPLAAFIMRNFAPAHTSVGLHWHHFGQPILPPIIETPSLPKHVVNNKIIVYLPFEDPNVVIKLLSPFEKFHFEIYSPVVVPSKYGHINCHPLSRDGFQKNLYDAVGIISNAGFELASEALLMGKKILAKPLHAQMEQISNAAALQQLGYGQVMHDLDLSAIEHWLHNPHAVQVSYPNSAKIMVKWIQDGMPEMDADFIEQVWSDVDVIKVELPAV